MINIAPTHAYPAIALSIAQYGIDSALINTSITKFHKSNILMWSMNMSQIQQRFQQMSRQLLACMAQLLTARANFYRSHYYGANDQAQK
ncbi:hypothetical protein SAMN05421749_11038 [Acinetobacter marinus]|uniref:Uncharacterized protein n=1 Tax=Acinetobacter marinus TaxID=281375 RepID=A0A1G6NM38_9GAMM|nr:hypothetical protein SAMN05421749_11038 [Acinetobacter marinus]